MRQLIAVAAAFTLLLAAAAPALAAELEFVAPDKLAAKVDEKTSVWVRNTGSGEATATLELATEKSATLSVFDAEGKSVDRDAVPVPGGAVIRFQVAADKEDKGELVARARGFGPGSLEFAASKKPVIDFGVTWVLVVAAITALAAMGWQSWRASGVRWRHFLPEADYDFKTSFASNITAGGAILATVISAGVLPEETVSFSKAGYTALSLVFAVAVGVAPLVYAASERRFLEKVGTDDKTVKRGRVGAFLLAAAIIIWATFGQLWTLAMLVDELTAAQGFSDALTVALWVILFIAAATVVKSTDRIQWALKKAARKLNADEKKANKAPSYELLEGGLLRKTSPGDEGYLLVGPTATTSLGDEPIALP